MNALTYQVIVQRREIQGGGIAVLELQTADDRSLPPFEAGAHVDVHLAPGLVRQYSLCGDPAEKGLYRLGVLRDPASRGGSQAVFDRLHEGEVITIGAPRNHFPLVAEAQHSVLVGGGIGITPMIAMAYALWAAGKEFELHYCSRSASTSAFLDELAAAPFASKVHRHFDDEGESSRLQLTEVLKAASLAQTHLYVCGPSGFMYWVIGSSEKLGLPKAQIHKEYFGADVNTHGGSFEVVAAASGKTVRVQEGQSIVNALKAVGINVDVSCQQGVCGTCLCAVLEGECDHRDVYLTDEEKIANDQIIACCSRAKSARLVLDV